MKAWIYVSPAAAIAAGKLTHGVLPVELTQEFVDELSTPLRDELGKTLGLGKHKIGDVAAESIIAAMVDEGLRRGAPPDPKLLGNGPGESASEATLEEVYRLLKHRADDARIKAGKVERERVAKMLEEMKAAVFHGVWTEGDVTTRLYPTDEEWTKIDKMLVEREAEEQAKRAKHNAECDRLANEAIDKAQHDGRGLPLSYIQGGAYYISAITVTPATWKRWNEYEATRREVAKARDEANASRVTTIVGCYGTQDQYERHVAGVLPKSELVDVLRAHLLRRIKLPMIKLDMDHPVVQVSEVTEFTKAQWSVFSELSRAVDTMPRIEDGIRDAKAEVVRVEWPETEGEPDSVQWAVIVNVEWYGVELQAIYAFPSDGKTEDAGGVMDLVRVAFGEGARTMAANLGVAVVDKRVDELFANVYGLPADGPTLHKCPGPGYGPAIIAAPELEDAGCKWCKGRLADAFCAGAEYQRKYVLAAGAEVPLRLPGEVGLLAAAAGYVEDLGGEFPDD